MMLVQSILYLLFFVVVDAIHTPDNVTRWNEVVKSFIPVVDITGPSAVFVIISFKKIDKLIH